MRLGLPPRSNNDWRNIPASCRPVDGRIEAFSNFLQGLTGRRRTVELCDYHGLVGYSRQIISGTQGQYLAKAKADA